MSEQQAAVAIAYDPASGQAPRVLAAGYGEIARRIMQIARDEGVHIHRDDTLAQLLVRVPVGKEIPEGAWQLVAELLAFLYANDRRLAEKIAAHGGQKSP